MKIKISFFVLNKENPVLLKGLRLKSESIFGMLNSMGLGDMGFQMDENIGLQHSCLFTAEMTAPEDLSFLDFNTVVNTYTKSLGEKYNITDFLIKTEIEDGSIQHTAGDSELQEQPSSISK